MADIIDYLRTTARVITAFEVFELFGVTASESNKYTHGAADLLYKMKSLGKLRSHKYYTPNSGNLYTLPDTQLTIADIPDGRRNDRVLELYTAGNDMAAIAVKLNISIHTVRRICRDWSYQRAELLAAPTNFPAF